MFDSQFGLTGRPFALTPDGRFFFSSSGHGRALSHLIYGLSQGEGFVVITGEVGAGKTTLMERLWGELDRSHYAVARIVTTQVTPDDFLRLVIHAFGLRTERQDQAALLEQFEALLRMQEEAGRRCLLVVDEVQSLPVAALEQLRMLSNLSGESCAPLQTVLLGQPQFRATLASPELDQLRQRVLAAYHLGPLGEHETHDYIEHRLRIVGWDGVPAWPRAASDAVHRFTGGIPRRINRLCSRLMVYADLEGEGSVTAGMAEMAARELDIDLSGPARPPGSLHGAGIEARVGALEDMFARRERVFGRLVELFAGYSGGR